MNQQEFYEYISNSEPLSFLDKEGERAVREVIVKVPEIRPFLSDECFRDMRRAYKKRMVPLYMRSTGKILLKQMRMIDPIGAADPTNADQNVVFRAMDSTKRIFGSTGEYYYDNYPIISEYADVMRGNFIESQVEFFQHFLVEKSRIESRFFEGRKITHIVRLFGGEGDLHRHGRAVMGVFTNVGNFYYKPHDCKLDVLYHTLITEYFFDCTIAADCVTGDGCGFASELKSETVASMEELPLYYRNFGKLLALFHGIGAVDMHFENIIPCGTKPCAIDLETMFKPEQRGYARNGVRKKKGVRKDIGRTVMRAGVLPHYIHGIGIVSPLYQAKGFDEGYLPEYAGKHFTIKGSENSFLEGFKQGYDRVLESRDRIKELFLSAEACELRILLRNSEYYNRMREFLWMPDALADRARQRQVLRRLRVPFEYGNTDVNENIVSYEEKCLLEGDIPYYCSTIDGLDLCGGSLHELIESRFMEKSAREKTFEDLFQLSGEDKIFETDLINESFRQVMTAVPKSSQDFRIQHAGDKQLLRKKERELIEGIVKEIYRCRIRGPNGEFLFLPVTPGLQLREACNPTVYAADVGRFLAAAKNRGFHVHEELIQNSLTVIKRQIKDWMQEDERYLRASVPLNLYGGAAALIMSLDEMSVADYEGAEDTFAALLSLIEEKGLYLIGSDSKTKDLAELILVLGMSRSGHQKKREIIGKSAERLAAYSCTEKGDVMTMATLGAAFALSYKSTQAEKYRNLSDEMFTKVSDRYDYKINGWAEKNGVFKWLCKCSKYSSWIGIMACAAASVTDYAGKTAEFAVKSITKESSLQYNDNLYHGNALTVLFLKYAADVLLRPGLHEEASDLMFSMIKRREETGAFHTSPEGIRDFFDVSLVFGVPGIGMAAIHHFD